MKDYLIINRKKWKTGSHGFGKTNLLNSDSRMMCCLGFRCEQMGIPKKDLEDKFYPSSLSREYTIPGLINSKGCNTKFANKAIEINDNSNITSEVREKRLIALFKKVNIIVEFEGKYVKKYLNEPE